MRSKNREAYQAELRMFAFRIALMLTETGTTKPNLGQVMQELEDTIISDAVILCDDNKSVTTKRLGISRTKLIYRLKAFYKTKAYDNTDSL